VVVLFKNVRDERLWKLGLAEGVGALSNLPGSQGVGMSDQGSQSVGMLSDQGNFFLVHNNWMN